MKKLLLLPFTIVCTSVISQTTPKLNSEDSINILSKLPGISPLDLTKKTVEDIAINKKYAFKKLATNMQGAKQFDHSFDPFPEPE